MSEPARMSAQSKLLMILAHVKDFQRKTCSQAQSGNWRDGFFKLLCFLVVCFPVIDSQNSLFTACPIGSRVLKTCVWAQPHLPHLNLPTFSKCCFSFLRGSDMGSLCSDTHPFIPCYCPAPLGPCPVSLPSGVSTTSSNSTISFSGLGMSLPQGDDWGAMSATSIPVVSVWSQPVEGTQIGSLPNLPVATLDHAIPKPTEFYSK